MATQNTCDNGSTTQVPSEKAISGKVFSGTGDQSWKNIGFSLKISPSAHLFL